MVNSRDSYRLETRIDLACKIGRSLVFVVGFCAFILSILSIHVSFFSCSRARPDYDPMFRVDRV